MKVCVILHVTGILIFCGLCNAASGGCSRYGHACWGGHGKRSSQPAKVLPLPLPLRDVRDLELADTVDTSEVAQDTDDGEAQHEDTVDAGRRRAYQVSGYGLNSLGDLISIPSEQTLQHPEALEESGEEIHRIRPQNRWRHKSRESDVQVLIIPDEESQLPDLHIYQILGHAPRKRV